MLQQLRLLRRARWARSGRLVLAGAALVLKAPFLAHGQSRPLTQPAAYRTVQVDGWSIFYREAGPKSAPTILLLHGLPSLWYQ